LPDFAHLTLWRAMCFEPLTGRAPFEERRI
jgi:hypothetical protein